MDPPSDPPSDNAVEPRGATTSTSSATREDNNNASSHSQHQQQHQHRSEVFEADNSSSRGEASESLSLQLVATEQSVKSDDSNTTGESISNIKPDQLPDYKDQVRSAAAAGEGRGASAGTTRYDGPRFKYQTQTVDEEGGGGGGDGDSGDGTTTIPWAQSVWALSERGNNNNHRLPTLRAAVLQTPPAADNTAVHSNSTETPSGAPEGDGGTQQVVLCKHTIWAVAFVVAIVVVAVSVALAVILSGKSSPTPTLSPQTLPPQTSTTTAAPTKTITPQPDEVTTAPPTLIPAVAPNPYAQIKLTASDGAAGDLFGISVAIAGETIIVGAEEDDTDNGIESGSAYVYTLSGSFWSEQAKLTASDGAPRDYFGYNVAIDGNNVVIGAWGRDAESGDNSGSVYVFTLVGTVWTEQAKLTASDGASDDRFGVSVAVGGDIVVVGAPDDSTLDNNSESGRAYVYTLSGTVWTEQAKLIASDAAADDRFGISVATSGGTIVIGAGFDDTESGSNSGSAYVYTGSGSVWTEQTKLIAGDGAANDKFGISVAVDGDIIVIGADENDYGNGRAYVFTLAGTVWTEQAKLLASDGAGDDRFGWSVAIDGNTIVIGAHGHATNRGENIGGAYVYAGSGTVWTEQAKLTASDGALGDEFGFSVAMDGGIFVIGANEDDIENGSDVGSVYIFE